MADENHHKLGDHSLPLPDEPHDDHSQAAAADLIRKKIDAAYQHEPDAATEALDAAETAPAKLSKHQRYVYDLTASGKPMAEIAAAWHEYYVGLTDDEKHEVWQEFNAAHSAASKLLAAQPHLKSEPPANTIPAGRKLPAPIVTFRDYLKTRGASYPLPAANQKFKSAAFGLGVGLVAIFITLFSFFNERFIAPFIQPSRSVSNTQIITATKGPVSTKPVIIIPKINVEIPVIYYVKSTSEKDVQEGLANGVVHYADTAQPGQNGNAVIVGHSANNIFNKGKYKFAFSLLKRLDNNDLFYLHKDGVRYTYKVFKKQVVLPSEVSVLAPSSKPAVATLITCDPPGSSARRLVVTGEQISPAPKTNKPPVANQRARADTAVLPGNSPSLWSRIVNWFTE